jgi:hypothetical protein
MHNFFWGGDGRGLNVPLLRFLEHVGVQPGKLGGVRTRLSILRILTGSGGENVQFPGRIIKSTPEVRRVPSYPLLVAAMTLCAHNPRFSIYFNCLMGQ